MLAAKITEELAKMKPEKLETSQVREITRVQPKSTHTWEKKERSGTKIQLQNLRENMPKE